MTNKLKRDQLPVKKAENWGKNFQDEIKKTFNLKVSRIIFQKATYKALIGENENRVRIYLGLNTEKTEGQYELCAYAVSAFLLGSGDVYADYETPVFKLDKKNIDVSDDIESVIESIRMYRKWRAGELDPEHAGAAFRQYIYPNAYLLTKYELHELFNVQNSPEVSIDFGISKTMTTMLSPMSATSVDTNLKSATMEEDESGPFDFGEFCPPNCDERSVYNPS